MRSPEIIAFDKGVIEWKSEAGVAAYSVKADGAAVRSADGTDGYYHGTAFDVGAFCRDVRVDIAAVYAGGGTSPYTSVFYSHKNKKLSYLPVTQFTAVGDILEWCEIGGVIEYRAVDLNFNAFGVFGNSYDMSGRNLLYGVYPVSRRPFISSAETVPTDMPYLRGAGTVISPYIINTAFDLRAVDYYELRYAERIKHEKAERNYYRIKSDIDFAEVRAFDSESNIYTLSKPFFGTLDGDGRTLGNIRVNFDGGSWALFDFIAKGGVVKNIVFKNPSITNLVKDPETPLNASIATVAFRNYGTVSGITINGAEYAAAGGEVCGVVSHNFGTVCDCAVLSSAFRQDATGLVSQTCYEMSGIVTENCAGGVVSGNTVVSLEISGCACTGRFDDRYNNVRTAGGIVAVNNAGGTVSGNRYIFLSMVKMLDRYDGTEGGSEWGGIVAYNAGTVEIGGNGNLGMFKWNGSVVTTLGGKDKGVSCDMRKKDVGKNDGTVIV